MLQNKDIATNPSALKLRMRSSLLVLTHFLLQILLSRRRHRQKVWYDLLYFGATIHMADRLLINYSVLCFTTLL